MSRLVATSVSIPGRLEETSLTLESGTLTCLIGPNGSGKTSLLHAIAGIGSPGGEVRIGGEDAWRATPAERPRLLTYLPASRDIRWPVTAADLIRLGGEEDIDSVLSELELESFADRRVDQLSTGERARVLIARALAPRPRVLLLDEPVANLDPLWQIKVMERLRCVARGGRAVLTAVHDLDLAGRYADRLIVMASGRIHSDGDRRLLDGPGIAAVFGVERHEGAWQPAARPSADRRSSP
jgi:iron complex transport system ATP-binding protein